ncbi:MAG: hypothetical protein IT452_10960 [Planctomycetia bacterium]|nr:hypothetical protein [Planctomycetia bacterium]
MLSQPSAFDPNPLWALFWAAVEAEGKFHELYVPYWSHEERLTGHLVSQLLERVEEFAPRWFALSSLSQQTERDGMRLAYFDTATASREKFTGADLGLVVHGDLGGGEFYKVARLQAKKANARGRCRIDLDQVEVLLSAEGAGYFIFYHFADARQGSPTPTVCAATDFADDVGEAKKERGGSKRELGEKRRDVANLGWDFATFLTFGLADPQSDVGAHANSAVEAARLVMAGRGVPSRLAVLTLGARGRLDWSDVLREHIRVADDQIEDEEE